MSLSNYLRPLFLLALTLLGVWLQAHIIITGDITWLMHMGKRLLAGGHYYHDFFEVNPPMCIYIYLMPVILSNILALSFITTVTLYLFILIALSLLICHILLKRLLPEPPRFLFECALLFATLILPAYAFGQREYLFVLFIIPYLLLITLRCQHQVINIPIALGIGLLAALGFSIKPFFLIEWLLLELYLIINIKHFRVWLRAEFIACLFIFISYGLSLFIITPEYLSQIVPLNQSIYYLTFHKSWLMCITDPTALFGLGTLAYYTIIRPNCQAKYLIDVLAISVTSMLVIYLIQRETWYYHVLPIGMISVLLSTILTYEHLQKIAIINSTPTIGKWIKTSIVAVLVICLNLFPVHIALINNTFGFYVSRLLFEDPIYSILKAVPQQPVYIFTDNISVNYPLLDYTNTYSASIFPSLWLLQAASDFNHSKPTQAEQNIMQTLIALVRASDTQSLIKQQPVYIFVPILEYYKKIQHNKSFLSISFALVKRPAPDYLAYFLQDKSFAQFWSNYRYQGRSGDFAVYKLDAKIAPFKRIGATQ